MRGFIRILIERAFVTVLLASTWVPAVQGQQAYPAKAIRLVTPYPPGGGTSVVARVLGQKLTENWGQQVLVDNRGGGNTIIGTELVAKSPPDGYTLILVVSTYVIVPSLIPTPYDVIKDFAPIAQVANSDYVLVIHPSIPAKNLKELIALAKARPGQLNYGSTGAGGVQHLAGESLNMLVGIKMEHIPYKGSGQLLPALIGGHVDMSFQVPPASLPHIQAGRIRPIATGGRKRLPSLPDIPTFAEAGLRGLEVTTWFGILAPGATPQPIVHKLADELARIITTPEVKEKLQSLGAEPFFSSSEEFAALLKSDMARYAKVIKAANIKAE